MIVSSVARTGLVADTRRAEAVQNTPQTNNDTAGLAEAVQQQAAASPEAQYTRAPEQSAAIRYSSVLNNFGTNGEGASAETAESSALQREVIFRNNATLQEQIAERVRLNYDLV